MEKGEKQLVFKESEALKVADSVSIRGYLTMLNEKVKQDDSRPAIPLGYGDPSVFPCYQTTPLAEDAIVDAIRSAKFNCYDPSIGILLARRAIAEYLSHDLPYQLSPDDVYLTVGCNNSIEVIISSLASPGANILLPRPGYPMFESRSAFINLEVRHFDLIPERGWEVDLDSVEAIADENSVAMVIVNHGNPCGNVFTDQHLQMVAETARKLGIFVISDDVYGHLAFGNHPFVFMGKYGSIVPVLTLGSMSKRWIVPGWRLGWIVTTDPNGIFKKSGVLDNIKRYLNISADPPTFIQGAVPEIIEKTKDDFFSKIVNITREAAYICYDRLKEIPCIRCTHKPEGSMYVMVKLNLSLLEDISDDLDFCLKLARSRRTCCGSTRTRNLVGITVGMKNWLRTTFAIEHSSLDEGIERINAFCLRHAKNQ